MKQQSYNYAYSNVGGYYYGNAYGGWSNKKKNPDGPDNNHGLDNDCLRIVLNIIQIEHIKTFYQTWDRKERVTFQRLIFIRRSMTLKELHLYIFKYFRGLFKKILEDKEICQKLKLKDGNEIKILKEGTNEEAFSTWNLSNSDEKKIAPYKIYLESNARQPYSYPYYQKGNCKLCQKSDCSECELEYRDDKTVQDLLHLLDPKNEIINDKYCYERNNSMGREDKDLEIKVVFNEKVEIPKDFREFEDASLTVTDSKKADLNIDKLFESFSIPDKLESGNEWYCPKCKKHLLATKKMQIYSTPPILVIHLKRFKSQSSHSSYIKKFEGLIDFPIKNLDMSKYSINSNGKESLYDLFAVSNHYGELGIGHYTSYAFNFEKKSWHEFNDSHVTSITENGIVSTAAYVLFYKRKELNLNELTDYEKIKNVVDNSLISVDKEMKGDMKINYSLNKPNKDSAEEVKIPKNNKENSFEVNEKENVSDSKTTDSSRLGKSD